MSDNYGVEYPATIKEKRKNSTRRYKRLPLWGCILGIMTTIITCCMVPVLIAGAIAATFSTAQANETIDRSTETLSIGEGIANLEVTNVVGETSIHGEDVNKITVEIERRATGLTKANARDALNTLNVDVSRDGNRYSIIVQDNRNQSLFEKRSVNLRITVPRKLNITARNSVGTLTIRDVEIVDQLNLHNSVGAIVFAGKIGPTGDHEITNNVGGIEVRLNKESNFRLSATAEVGGIDSSLNLKDETASRHVTNQQLSGTYGGSNPDATLTITASVGGIKLID